MISMINENMIEKTGVLDLVWRVFMEFEAPDYSDEGIREFRDFIEPAAVIERIKRDELLLWGWWDNDRLAGMIATKPPCHISLLFVDKEYHRRGIAKNLYRTVLAHYIESSDHKEMTVNSSPYAVEVYQNLGFISTNSEQTVNGLRFTPMKHRFR